ncbi:MAG: FAD:protein FMN transferase [Plesiomonas sp.]|uniref:FAD:protein FMN transferase n=1 Tax=Plesiomonas sp. TaxID=2486279 RepID=UPI003F3B18CA
MLVKTKQWLALVGLAFFLSGCNDSTSNEQVNLQGQTMGTYYSIKYLNQKDLPAQDAVQAEIDKRLELVNDQMSTYRPTSELSRFNSSTAVNTPFAVSADTAKVVREALRINQVTHGALDVTVGPLVNLWGFGPEGRPDKVPSDDELAKRRARIGIQYLSVQGDALVKGIPPLYVDLSSIAKGFGVDQVAEYLASLGIQNYMVEIGGEVRLKGHNAKDKPWRIAIEKPIAGTEQTAQEIIAPLNMAIATSGDYRNYFEQDGVRFSHTIDPRTGKPIQHKMVSITVIAPTCMEADGLSTGLNVLGEEEALKVANQHNIAAFMVIKTPEGFTEVASEAFKPYLQK